MTGRPRQRFDADYYHRFYRDCPVHDRRRIAHLATGVTGLCGWWGISLRSVLDWRRHRPGADSVRRQRPRRIADRCERLRLPALLARQADISKCWRRARRPTWWCAKALQYLDDDVPLATETWSRLRVVLFLRCRRWAISTGDRPGRHRHGHPLANGELVSTLCRTALRADGGGSSWARDAGLKFYELERCG
jgi:hypothetical protein